MKNRFVVFFPMIALLVVGSSLKAGDAGNLIVMTHDSFSASKQAIEHFERESGATVRFLKANDAGAALNQAILTKSNPMADLFFGVDNTFLSRALNADIFQPYKSPLLEQIPEIYQLDRSYRLLPVDFGDVCLNYDKAWFAKRRLLPPSTLEDLIDPAYRGLTVVENPATSSPGLAFLLTTIGHFGADGFTAYWRSLRDNGLSVTDSWNNAYWGEFTAASKGTRPIVVSYASSPPATVFFAETPLREAPTAAVLSKGTAFRQIEFVGILKGTKKRETAEKFVDFVLDRKFQEDMPLQMFVFPVNRNAKLPKIFADHASIAADPVKVSYDEIERNREEWIEMWTEAVLR